MASTALAGLMPVALWADPPIAAPITVPITALVTSAQQVARDSDRLRILQDELVREQDSGVEATKRRAERLAAGDNFGVQAAEQAQRRAAQNAAAIERELAVQRPAVSARATGAPMARAVPTGAWWDVYARPLPHQPPVPGERPTHD